MTGERRSWRRLPRVGRPDVLAEVRTEVEAHIAMQVADLVAEGMSPEAARAEALRRFGNRAGIEREMLTISRKREGEMRRSQYLEDLGQDVRLALRQLRRRPLFALVAVAVIALGIGANAAVFAVVDGALWRPLPFPDARSLVSLETTGSFRTPTYPDFEDWQEQAGFLQSVAAGYTPDVTVRTPTGPEVDAVGMLAGDPQATFRVRPVVGRWFTAEEIRSGARVALLDEGFWRERYGVRRDVIGTTLRLDDDVYTIIGVVPRTLALTFPDHDQAVTAWLPLQRKSWMGRGTYFMQVYGRLAPGVAPAVARARATAVSSQIVATGVTRDSMVVRDLRTSLVGDSRRLLLVLLGAVTMVLLIVCANLASLFASRGLERAGEFAVRASLGAAPARLLRQVVTESVVIGVAGGVVGLGLSRAMLGVTRAVAQQAGALAPSRGVDPRVVLFTLGLSVVVGLLFGVLPARAAARPALASALREGDGARSLGSRTALRQRRALVALEIALSVVLLTGAGLLVRSVYGMLTEDPGFRPEHVLSMDVVLRGARYQDDARQIEFTTELVDRLRTLPGVMAAGAGSDVPLGSRNTYGGFEIPGRVFPEGTGPTAKKRRVSDGYFEAMGIPVLRGRAFRPSDRQGSPYVLIISEALAKRFWPGQDPVGKHIGDSSTGQLREGEIVGVVGDVRDDGLDRPVSPTIYRSLAQFSEVSNVSFVVRGNGDLAALSRAMRSEVQALDPTVPVADVRTMEAVVHASVAPQRSFMLLLAGFAAIALVLAMVGVYAVAAQAVAQRTREIGLRMALGAGPGEVLRLVVREELAVILGGLLLGLGAAFLATRALAAFLYQVDARDPLTFLAVAALLAVVGLVASYAPARRAADMDPVSALRTI